MGTKLSFDAVNEIVSKTNIEYVDTTLSTIGNHLSKDEKDIISKTRKDPTRVFKSLTDDTQGLVKLMRNTRTVLSGSRALDFFVPESCSDDADWDFYCESSLLSFGIFTYFMHLDFNVSWSIKDLITTEHDGFIYAHARFKVLRGVCNFRNKSHEIQVITRIGLPATSCILKFHSTAPQCFISGIAAVSLQSTLTKDNKCVLWANNDDPASIMDNIEPTPVIYVNLSTFNSMTLIEESSVDEEGHASNINENEDVSEKIDWKTRNAQAKEKYQDKGFDYIDFEHYSANLSRTQMLNANLNMKTRYIGDKDCSIISMQPYMEDDGFLYSEWIKQFVCISWYETPDLVTIINDIPEFLALQTTKLDAFEPQLNNHLVLFGSVLLGFQIPVKQQRDSYNLLSKYSIKSKFSRVTGNSPTTALDYICTSAKVAFETIIPWKSPEDIQATGCNKQSKRIPC